MKKGVRYNNDYKYASFSGKESSVDYNRESVSGVEIKDMKSKKYRY